MNLYDGKLLLGTGMEGIMFEIPIVEKPTDELSEEERTALVGAIRRSVERIDARRLTDILLIASEDPEAALNELQDLKQQVVEDTRSIVRHDDGLEALEKVDAVGRGLFNLGEAQMQVISFRKDLKDSSPPWLEGRIGDLATHYEIRDYTNSLEALDGLTNQLKALSSKAKSKVVEYSNDLIDILTEAIGDNQTRIKRLLDKIQKSDEILTVELTDRQISTLTKDGDAESISRDLSGLTQALKSVLVKHSADIKKFDDIAYSFVKQISSVTSEDVYEKSLFTISRVIYPKPIGFKETHVDEMEIFASELLPGGKTLMMQMKAREGGNPETIAAAFKYVKDITTYIDYQIKSEKVEVRGEREVTFSKSDLIDLCGSLSELNTCYDALIKAMRDFNNGMKRWQQLTQTGQTSLTKQEWISTSEMDKIDKLFDLYQPELSFYTKLVPRVVVYIDRVMREALSVCYKAV